MTVSMKTISIVGGGLAGSEAAFQLAERGHQVRLYEMRPQKSTPAHKSADFAELVCSNSFGSVAHHAVSGQLKWEAERMGSLILECAGLHRVPAGQALGIDRLAFAAEVTKQLQAHPNIQILSEEVLDVESLPRPAIVATGPLTGDSLAQSLLKHFKEEFLYFFDAIAPIVDADSIDRNQAWVADRYGKGTGDYINCPLNKEQYYQFIQEIKDSEKTEAKDFEKETPFFEGCMPIEEMIRRGDETLRYGPLSPKGLTNPHCNEKPYAVVQLRKENRAGTSYNLVGFQTKMKYFEQKRIFQMIPGLQEAQFLKLGSIHRNMYINPTQMLTSQLSSLYDPELFLAGQITGVEGYFESTCIGLLTALFLDGQLKEQSFLPPPPETAMGSLHYALTGEKKDHFQPTNINMGLFPPLERRYKKREKRDQLVQRARKAFLAWEIEHKPVYHSQPFIMEMADQLANL
ncbi:MAG: methylenetetrahydrofolate--tRNA-(uracil(54)-C(5))-methyltransferase (FADH(2)-oxidizing) TrmFO [Pseudomonadota bacterium]